MLNHLILGSPSAKSRNRLSWYSSRAEVALVLVIIVISIKLYYLGAGNRIAVLFLGAVLSAFILHGLSRPRSLIHIRLKVLLYSPCRYVPYLFSLYLFFFEGFWRLAKILQGFNYFDIALAAFFFIGGNMVVSAGYMAMEHAETEMKKKQFAH